MKMKTKLTRAVLLLTAMGSLTFVSCKKEKNPSSGNTNTEAVAAASEDDAVLESTFNEAFDDASGIDDASAGEDIGLYGSGGFGIFSQVNPVGTGDVVNSPQGRCFTVTVEPMARGVFPKTVTIDFGTGCEVRGHLRKGKIIITYSGKLHIPGSKAVTTFDNYYLDSFKIEGKHTLENTSSNNQRSFTVTIEEGKVTNVNSGKWCKWNSTRNITQIEGNGTPFWPLDDIFRITGSTRGECSDGKSWTAETTEPLIKKFTCRWIVKGIIKITVNNTTGELNYGDGTCDNKATVTINGEVRVIRLR